MSARQRHGAAARVRARLTLIATVPWLLGSGWPVYDAANHAENLRQGTLLTQLLQRHDSRLLPDLHELLQVGHRQYEAWQDYLQRVGDPRAVGTPFAGLGEGSAPAWSWGDAWGFGGDGPAWWDGRGALRIYGQLGRDGWRSWIRDSWRTWIDSARDAWLAELGATAGWREGEIEFAQWLARQSPGELRAKRHEIARNAARLASERWLESGDERRERLSDLAALVARQQQAAQRPSTLLEALIQQNEAAAQAATVSLEGIRQQAESQEALLLLQRATLDDAAEAGRRQRWQRELQWANLDEP